MSRKPSIGAELRSVSEWLASQWMEGEKAPIPTIAAALYAAAFLQDEGVTEVAAWLVELTREWRAPEQTKATVRPWTEPQRLYAQARPDFPQCEAVADWLRQLAAEAKAKDPRT